MNDLNDIAAGTDIAIDAIEVGNRLRQVSEPTVAALQFVIAEFGFTVPILVRKMRVGYRLIDGAHRLAVLTRAGRSSIPAVAIKCTDEEAQVLEGSQNLAGAALSPLDEAIFVAAFGAAWQKLHPETGRGLAGARAKNGFANELSSFAEIIAEKRSISTRQIQKIARAGRHLSRADADRLRGGKRKLTLQDVQDIGKIGEDDEREFVIAALVEGKKASAARRVWQAQQAGVQPIVKDPVEEAFNAMTALWVRAPKAAKRRFAEELATELAQLIEGGDDDE